MASRLLWAAVAVSRANEVDKERLGQRLHALTAAAPGDLPRCAQDGGRHGFIFRR